MDRDLETHRLTARLRTLRRFGLDLCLGHMVAADDSDPVYVGRLGLTDSAGRRLLVHWRSPVAEPFFGATHGNPMGLTSRRRYRWTRGRISDYWDEVFTAEGFDGHAAALDDQSAFIASLGTSRSSRMRDVLGTIQSDQDAVIRAGSRGALVVDGGPGTGKTVVALHRAAYLLYSDPRLGHRRGGVLFVGPHQPYLAYVADVLPSLGEEGVGWVPTTGQRRSALRTPVHRTTRPATRSGRSCSPSSRTGTATTTSHRTCSAGRCGRTGTWPMPSAVRGRCCTTPTWSATCGPSQPTCGCARPGSPRTRYAGSSAETPRPGRCPISRCWTRPGTGSATRRPQAAAAGGRRQAAAAAEREHMTRVIDDLVAADDSEMLVMSMLRGRDLQNALVDEAALPETDPDALAGPFAHVVVDEAKELDDAQWQMLLLRCPSRSLTIVGDRAQARHGFGESWREQLERIGLSTIDLATLRINYRTLEEVMAEAEPVIQSVLPDANLLTSVRSTGVPVTHASVPDLGPVLRAWLTENAEGTACVIAVGDVEGAGIPATSRVRSLGPELANGLELDLVVLVDPESFGPGVEGAVDRYVAMTRATQRLVILTSA